MRDRRARRSIVAAFLGVLLLSAAAYIWRSRAVGLAPREVPLVAFPVENPFADAWTTVEAFPGVAFERPVVIVQEVGGDGTYFVAQQNGLVLAISERPSPRSEPFLDLRSKVEDRAEAGLVGLALHPDFGIGASPESRFFYVFYVARLGDRMSDRLSRFEVDASGNRGDPASELVLIEQLDEDTDHNSGQLQFGPDRFLYVGVGDEGGIGDQFFNGQRIDKDLFSGILRIDVDCRGADVSSAIRKQPQTGRTQGYCIPRSNPFVGLSGALEEFWAIGFRNPHRFSFDPPTGLWGGDVGQDRREEVFVAAPGSNHQWSYREGTMPFPEGPFKGQQPPAPIGVGTTPVFEYPHTDGNGAVIGGYVYRGMQFSELTGKYVFGDYNAGRVGRWSHLCCRLMPLCPS